tara:strand:- start:1723 stop:1992 length:270 start_codon:yes stop_codon:yes gene_type:complete
MVTLHFLRYRDGGIQLMGDHPLEPNYVMISAEVDETIAGIITAVSLNPDLEESLESILSAFFQRGLDISDIEEAEQLQWEQEHDRHDYE